MPQRITLLTFGWNFNQDISNLPYGITHLIFGWNFNQDTSKLPNSLTHLTLDNEFREYYNIQLHIKYYILDYNI